jgi:hypothetical protein
LPSWPGPEAATETVRTWVEATYEKVTVAPVVTVKPMLEPFGVPPAP